MQVLITGGAGFIGSHLCEHAIEQGASVTVLDDLSTGSLQNVEGIRPDRRFDLRIGSVRDVELVNELVSRTDYVFHLAATVGVRLVMEEPVKSVENNLLGTQTVLSACARHRKPVLLASSSEVYGKGVRVPFVETADLLLGPTYKGRWSYACSKAMGEWQALAHARESGLNVTVARLFNTVGPRQVGSFGMVLPRFCEQALSDRPLTVYGTGEQTRSFAHVRDTVRALILLVDAALETPWPSPEAAIFNVGSNREITIRSLAERVRAAAGSEAPILNVPFQEVYGRDFEDLGRRVPDLSRLVEATGFLPEVDIDQIVAEVLEETRRVATV